MTWIPVYVLQIGAALTLDVPSRMASAIDAIRNGHEPALDAVTALAAYGLVSLLVMFVAVPLGHGALITAIAAIRAGGRPSVAACYRAAFRRAPAFLGAIVAITALIVVAEIVLYVVAALLMSVTGASVLLLSIVYFAGALLPLFIAAPFAVSPQAVVLEAEGPIGSLRRSRDLLRGRYWIALAVLVVLGFLGWMIGLVLGLPVRAAGGGTAGLVAGAVAGAAGAILISPLIVVALTTLYFTAGGTGVAAVHGADEVLDPSARPSRRLQSLAIGVAAFLLIGAGGDNTAVAINTKDNSSLIKVSFKIVRLDGDVVAPTNFALAYASCTSCETAAIAIEAVFVTTTDASVVSPVNEAWAVNYACTNCQTLADAYQFTETTPGPIHFTAEGNREIAQIRRRLHALAHSDMTVPELVTAVQGLTDQLQQVLETEVVPAGQPAKEQPSPPVAPATAESPQPSPSSAQTPSPSASPEPSAQPSPTESPSPSPSPS